MDTNDELALIRSIGVPELRWAARTRGGGGGACATVQLAAAAVESGHADAVLIYRAFNERSGHRFGQPQRAGNPDPAWNFHMPFGLDTPAKVYALSFQRYMYENGLTNADFGRYSVVARDWASTNPNAQFYERPITLEDHQASRWIVEPILRKLDCCLESDGGVGTRRHPGRAGRRPRHRRGAHPRRRGRPPRGRPRDVRLLRPGPRRAPGGGRPRSAALRRGRDQGRRDRRGHDLRELQPHRVPPARGASASADGARRATSSPTATSAAAAPCR